MSTINHNARTSNLARPLAPPLAARLALSDVAAGSISRSLDILTGISFTPFTQECVA